MTEPLTLAQRLRDADIHSQQRVMGCRIFGEAADRIEALEAWKAEAMEVLEPFAGVVLKAEAAARNMMCDHKAEVDDEREYGPLGVHWKHLRAARRLVEKEDGHGRS